MKLGPILKKSVALIVPEAREIFGSPIDEELEVDCENFAFWLTETAIPRHLWPYVTLKLLKDTPDLLGYCIHFDDLYPIDGAAPGWMIGEAARQAVRDEVRAELGLQVGERPGY